MCNRKRPADTMSFSSHPRTLSTLALTMRVVA